MRIRYLAIMLLALLMMAPSCAPAPPTLSPAGSAAFQATRVVKALDVLRDMAVDGNAQAPPLLSTASTRHVVQFHQLAIETIGAVPGGWKSTIVAGLTELERDLLPAEWRVLLPYVALVKTLIAGVV